MFAPVALKFISGKYLGGEFPLPQQGEIIVGRSSEAEMPIMEEMVSRRHAKFVMESNCLSLLDLGSTNGTYVNGERISKTELHRDDRILMGSSIIRVIDANEISLRGEQLALSEVRKMLEQIGKTRESDTAMAGELEEVPLPDLLQLFASNRKSGVLIVKGKNQGKIILKEGQVITVQVAHHALTPRKAFIRMVQWESGHFELKILNDSPITGMFDESTEALLIEALRQIDEKKRLASHLPDEAAMIALPRPMPARLRELTLGQLDALQLFATSRNFGDALDQFPGSDLDAAHMYIELAQAGYLEELRQMADVESVTKVQNENAKRILAS